MAAGRPKKYTESPLFGPDEERKDGMDTKLTDNVFWVGYIR
jgi:hypothetical protein